MRVITTFLLAIIISAGIYAQDEKIQLKEYLNEAAVEVNETDDPEEKREILDNMFHELLGVFDIAEDWPMFSDDEKAMVKDFRLKVESKHDELNGYNGFERVLDKDLNSFASYTVHDFEQAAEYVTISIAALVIILLLVILLL